MCAFLALDSGKDKTPFDFSAFSVLLKMQYNLENSAVFSDKRVCCSFNKMVVNMTESDQFPSRG